MGPFSCKQAALQSLWSAAFPGEAWVSPRTERWKDMGWQVPYTLSAGTMNPEALQSCCDQLCFASHPGTICAMSPHNRLLHVTLVRSLRSILPLRVQCAPFNVHEVSSSTSVLTHSSMSTVATGLVLYSIDMNPLGIRCRVFIEQLKRIPLYVNDISVRYNLTGNDLKFGEEARRHRAFMIAYKGNQF